MIASILGLGLSSAAAVSSLDSSSLAIEGGGEVTAVPATWSAWTTGGGPRGSRCESSEACAGPGGCEGGAAASAGVVERTSMNRYTPAINTAAAIRPRTTWRTLTLSTDSMAPDPLQAALR